MTARYPAGEMNGAGQPTRRGLAVNLKGGRTRFTDGHAAIMRSPLPPATNGCGFGRRGAASGGLGQQRGVLESEAFPDAADQPVAGDAIAQGARTGILEAQQVAPLVSAPSQEERLAPTAVHGEVKALAGHVESRRR